MKKGLQQQMALFQKCIQSRDRQLAEQVIDVDGDCASIVTAKAAAYVVSGQFLDGEWAYHDSYVGSTEFPGQLVVYFRRHPVWAMNYCGCVLDDTQISAAEAARMIKESLTLMYKEGRFLGDSRHTDGNLTYVDTVREQS